MRPMSPVARAGWLYALLVVVPTSNLAYWAWRATELDARAKLAAWRELIGGVAKSRATEVETSAREAARRAEASRVVAFARDGRWLGYDPRGGEAAEPPADDEELRYYRLSRRGGESYEARGDPARAVDAYSFFLPRIRSLALRARLSHSAARAARKSGAASLARALERELFESGEGLRTEEGLPVDLVAALELLREPAAQAGGIRERALERLESNARGLSTALLSRLAAVLDPDGKALRRVVEERQALEQACRASPEILSSRAAAVAGSTLVVVKDEVVEGQPLRALRAVSWSPPAPSVLDAGDYTYHWDATLPPSASGEAHMAAHPIVLQDGGPVLGHVVIENESVLEGLRRHVQGWPMGLKLLVGLHTVVTLLGGAALAFLLHRERQVARLRERLLANVSHELKTPVTSVRMFAELLGQPGLGAAEARNFADHLRRESARLSQLLENLLDLSRPERVDVRLVREPVDIRALVREVSESFAYRARQASVDFATEGLDGGGSGDALVLETNGPAVERIVLNLLDNALKYRRAEGSRIVLRLSSGEGGVRVAVEDNGPGIAERDRPRVFEEFYRGRFEDYGVKGAGLGLSIARRLARNLEGDVELETREGAGCTFSLALPKAAPSEKGTAT